MKPKFGYPVVRVQDGAIEFFRRYLGMRLRSQIKTKWVEGELASLVSQREKHSLEPNWYADDSPMMS